MTWLAAAGIKAGTSYGHCDDRAYQAAEGKTYRYDFHATVLHFLVSILNGLFSVRMELIVGLPTFMDMSSMRFWRR